MELVNMKRVKTGHLRCVLSGAFKLLDCSVHYSSFISAPPEVTYKVFIIFYFNLPSTAFQLTTSQTALKYSALRF
jgi:hypothetical protein